MASLDEMNPAQFLFHQEMIREIQRAKILGDRTSLEQLKKAIDEATALPQNNRQYLAGAISDCQNALPKDTVADPMIGDLNKLAADSRGWLGDVVEHAGGVISNETKHVEDVAKLEGGKLSKGFKHGEKVVHNIGTNLSNKSWGEMGRNAFPAATAIMAARYSQRVHSSLTPRDRAVLEPHFGADTLRRVLIVWGVSPLNEWHFGNAKVNLGGVEAEAQTYGYVIYVRGGYSDYSDWSRLSILTHELTHVKQYERFGRRLDNFGYHYFMAYKEANENYMGNELEREAYAASDRLTPLVLSAYRQRR
jgi:hypothetical protein